MGEQWQKHNNDCWKILMSPGEPKVSKSAENTTKTKVALRKVYTTEKGDQKPLKARGGPLCKKEGGVCDLWQKEGPKNQQSTLRKKYKSNTRRELIREGKRNNQQKSNGVGGETRGVT